MVVQMKYIFGTMTIIDALMIGVLLRRHDLTGVAIFFAWWVLHYVGYRVVR